MKRRPLTYACTSLGGVGVETADLRGAQRDAPLGERLAECVRLGFADSMWRTPLVSWVCSTVSPDLAVLDDEPDAGGHGDLLPVVDDVEVHVVVHCELLGAEHREPRGSM